MNANRLRITLAALALALSASAAMASNPGPGGGTVPPKALAAPDEDCPPSCPASPAAFGHHGAPDPIRLGVKPGTGPTDPEIRSRKAAGPRSPPGQGGPGPSNKAPATKTCTGKAGPQACAPDANTAMSQVSTTR